MKRLFARKPLGLLLQEMEGENWIRLFVWLGLGLVIYFAYGRRHSVMRHAEASEEAYPRSVESEITPLEKE